MANSNTKLLQMVHGGVVSDVNNLSSDKVTKLIRDKVEPYADIGLYPFVMRIHKVSANDANVSLLYRRYMQRMVRVRVEVLGKMPPMYKFVGGDITFNPNIDIKTFKTICEESKGVQLFDVREPRELEVDGRIPGALNIPIGEVESAFGLGETDFNTKYGVPKPKATDDNIIFFCKSGGRGLRACKCIEKYGYKRALNLDGGYMAWKEQMKE